MFSQGVNQSVQGSDKVSAIINLHLATGRIGKPGAGPFSITGQPNAMGGREVGGLASMLAAHMNFSPPESGSGRRFWGAPNIAVGQGLKAVDMFEARPFRPDQGDLGHGDQPAVSLPNAGRVARRLAIVRSWWCRRCRRYRYQPSRACPAARRLAWGEKAEVSPTGADEQPSAAFLDTPGEAKADWWIISPGRAPHGLCRAGLQLSARDLPRACAPDCVRESRRALSRPERLDRRDYDAMEPRRWGGDGPFRPIALDPERQGPAGPLMQRCRCPRATFR
jgi:assimilatory nitrate reductase catalytic subunit